MTRKGYSLKQWTQTLPGIWIAATWVSNDGHQQILVWMDLETHIKTHHLLNKVLHLKSQTEDQTRDAVKFSSARARL